MSQPTPLSDGARRTLVESLVTRSGLPLSAAELETLVASAGAVEEAVQRLYAVPMDHETEPALALGFPERQAP
jgi:hypothetical protein